MSAREIIAANQDLSQKPLGIKTLREGYVANVKAMFRSKLTEYDYRDPFSGAKIFYPETAAPSQATEPLSTDQISSIFRRGVDGGLLDEALLPLLGHLTGRRLGLLVHRMGSDIREKYRGVWVAQTNGIIKVGKPAWDFPRRSRMACRPPSTLARGRAAPPGHAGSSSPE